MEWVSCVYHSLLFYFEYFVSDWNLYLIDDYGYTLTNAVGFYIYLLAKNNVKFISAEL